MEYFFCFCWGRGWVLGGLPLGCPSALFWPFVRSAGGRFARSVRLSVPFRPLRPLAPLLSLAPSSPLVPSFPPSPLGVHQGKLADNNGRECSANRCFYVNRF